MSMLRSIAIKLLEPIIHQIDERTTPRTWSSWNWEKPVASMPPLAEFAPRAPRPASPTAGSSASPSATAQSAPSVSPAGLEELKAALQPKGRPLIIHHWATWCEPCEGELPLVERLAQRLAGKADVLGVSWDHFEAAGDRAKVTETVRAFASRQGVTWPTLLFVGTPEDLFQGLPLPFQRIPQTKVLDATGREVCQFDGLLSDADLERIVQLLGA